MNEATETTAGTQDTTMTSDAPVSVDKWRDTIPEDIRNNKIVQETPDITTMAKRLIDANNYISKSVRLPDNGDTSGMDELYNKLGRPESVDGYEVKRPELKEGQEYSEDMEKSFLEAAHKAGLNSSQVNSIMEWNNGQSINQQKEVYDNSAKAAKALKTEWGNAFEERIAVADEILGQFGDDAAEQAIRDNPALIKMVYNMGKNLVEGTAAGDGKPSHVRTPGEAQAEIDKLNRDPAFKNAYFNKQDPTHDASVEQMRKLMEEAHPEPAPLIL